MTNNNRAYFIIGDTDFNCSFFSAAAKMMKPLVDMGFKVYILLPRSFRNINIPDFRTCWKNCYYIDRFEQVKEFIKKGWQFDDICKNYQDLDSPDTTLVYFLGHGLVNVGKFKYYTEEVTYESYYSFLLENKYNQNKKYGERNIICVFDCCYSGQAIYYAGTGQNNFIPTLTSSNVDEISYATDSGTLFTPYFIRLLNNDFSFHIFVYYPFYPQRNFYQGEEGLVYIKSN